MKNLYGLSKLALLNTAGYAKCVIPLDKSSSICAPNNTGKSSVINALQFPLINDLRLTEWDGHDLDETRKLSKFKPVLRFFSHGLLNHRFRNTFLV